MTIRPRYAVVLWCVAIFVFAFVVRTLTWQDNKRDAWRVQTQVTAGYKDSARTLLNSNYTRFLSDVTYLGHPPGYPILLAVIFKLAGESDTALQVVQFVCDSIAVVILFLIALELFELWLAAVTGLLGALSPQFAYFSILLLPDSLIVLPILLAIYVLVLGRRRFSFRHFLIAGALIGLSCWLRPNALLMAPFIALTTPLFVEKSKRFKAAGGLVAGLVLAISPITIKNAIVFHRFIPVSLGAGQTLLEGIADYDEAGRFNIPVTDLGIMRQEAEWYGKPEYAQFLFDKDGIERDRMRINRGMSVILKNPAWFAGVMGQRAMASTRLDPVPVLRQESPVSHDNKNARVAWEKQASGVAGERSREASFTVESEWLKIRADEKNYGQQLISDPINVQTYHDYVLEIPFKLETGRALIEVADVNRTTVLASQVIDLSEGLSEQPVQQISLPFVSAGNSQVRFVISNNAAAHSTMRVGPTRVAELGSSTLTLVRYVRMPLRTIQRIFTTAWFLPLTIIGIVLLIARRQLQELVLLLAVPAYYLIVQSALHTERRYVYIIHFFFLILASTTLVWLAAKLVELVKRRT